MTGEALNEGKVVTQRQPVALKGKNLLLHDKGEKKCGRDRQSEIWRLGILTESLWSHWFNLGTYTSLIT